MTDKKLDRMMMTRAAVCRAEHDVIVAALRWERCEPGSPDELRRAIGDLKWAMDND